MIYFSKALKKMGIFGMHFTITAIESESEVTQSCLTLCDPMDYSLSGSSVHGIFQARVLKWVAISFFFPLPGFPGGSEVKVSASNAGDPDSIPGSGRKWQPTLAFLPGESHGRRSLAGYSPWSHKESDMTERLHFHFSKQ